MDQLSFVPESGQTKGLPEQLLEYRPNFIDKAVGEELLQKLIREIPWKQSVQKMYDKQVLTPRLTAWFGDFGTDYSAEGKVADPLP